MILKGISVISPLFMVFSGERFFGAAHDQLVSDLWTFADSTTPATAALTSPPGEFTILPL